MSDTVHYVPFAVDYERLLPPLLRDARPDRVVLLTQQLETPGATELTALQEAFRRELTREGIAIDEQPIDDPYDFPTCLEHAYQRLRADVEAGHAVHVNAAAIPELVGLSYVSAARMLAAELRTDPDARVVGPAVDGAESAGSVSVYYSAPQTFPPVEFLAHRHSLRQINTALQDLGSITEHVQIDRQFVEVFMALFEDDRITDLIDNLDGAEAAGPPSGTLAAGLRDIRDGLEQFMDGVNALDDADLSNPTANPELLALLVEPFWDADLEVGPETFAALQEGTHNISGNVEDMMQYFKERFSEIDTFVQEANPVSETELEELLAVSDAVGSQGLTGGRRRFDDGHWQVALPLTVDSDLSATQHAIVYTLYTVDTDATITSITDLAKEMLARATACTLAGFDRNATEQSWQAALREQGVPEDDIDGLVASTRNKIQYNLDERLSPAGFIDWVTVDKRSRAPRLTTSGQYWATVHYDEVPTDRLFADFIANIEGHL